MDKEGEGNEKATWEEKADLASNPRYDSGGSSQGLDNEILARKRTGRIVAVCAIIFMALFTFAFFTYAIKFAFSFIETYKEHVVPIYANAKNGVPGNFPPIVPLLVPMVPASFFSLLGVITLITGIRFITSYISPDENEESDWWERLVQALTELGRSLKYGNSDGL